MYFNLLYRVKKQIGNKLYLMTETYKWGWSDPRSVFKGKPLLSNDDDMNYLIVDMELCEPITKEVADIMRAV
jgi:hypothetical protein